MIYLTGDLHREIARIYYFCKRMQTTKKDILVVLGDAGLNYHLNDLDENLKKDLESWPITLLCIHGNHEQRPYAIETYEEREWHGGVVYAEPRFPSILFAKDGEIYNFEGKKAIALGGAYSVDKYYRLLRGYPWYDNEQPSEDIKRYVEEQLNKVNWEVDYVLSHTAPLQYEPKEVFLSGIDQSRVDKSTEKWLGQIAEKLKYKAWYCGHYHTEKKVQFLFENFTTLSD